MEVEEAYDRENRPTSFAFQFKANKATTAHLLTPNYQVVIGMPLTLCKDIDFGKQHQRYSKRYCLSLQSCPTHPLEVKAELASDFAPYLEGMTGQAVISDVSGKLAVQVQIFKAPKEKVCQFTKGKSVTMKGTFKQICMLTRPNFDFVQCTFTRSLLERFQL